MDPLAVLRAVAGAALLAWLPGYLWVRVLMPHVEGVARFALALGLSVSMMTLCLYAGNVLLDVALTAPNAVAYAVFLVALAGAPRLFRLARERLTPALS